MIRQDIFRAGDQVKWDDDLRSRHLDICTRLGNGPFIIIEVRNVTKRTKSIGHTQLVKVAEDNDPNSLWSGAFFRKVED